MSVLNELLDTMLIRRVMVELTKNLKVKHTFKRVDDRSYTMHDEKGVPVIHLSVRPNGSIDVTVDNRADDTLEDRVRAVVHRYGGQFQRVMQNDTKFMIPGRIAETLVHRKDGWHIMSKDGQKHLGGPYSKEYALKRLRQIEYFKHR